MISKQPAGSPVEKAKQASEFLRGDIGQTLADGDVASFKDGDKQVLKFHGIYQQDDRDHRNERRGQGLDKAYSFMLRIAIPGGVLTADQYLAIDELTDRYANGSLRLTTRQAIQLHGVLKSDLKGTIADIHQTLLTTMAACGDVARNVMASPAPFAAPAYREAQRLARDLAVELAPATGAYHEIWLDGERVASSDVEEPFYGESYLPRKFKLGVAIDQDNSIDAYAYDAALIGITEGDRIVRYNVVVGGGFGMTHNKPETIARLASPIGSVTPDRAIEAIRTIVAVFRDQGDRSNRRAARIKYLVERWGVARFRQAVEERLAWSFDPAVDVPNPRQVDYIGRFDQGDGRQFLGVFIESGRIRDDGERRVRSAVREIVRRYRPGVRLTPMQSVLFTDLSGVQIDEIERILREHGVSGDRELSNARRYSMACPALPTCGLALAESERYLPELIGELELVLEELGLAGVPLNVRMTGCPNGCARPYNADIGLVGRRPGVYHVYVGGGLGGDRLADLFAADVAAEEIVPTLRPLLGRFSVERADAEGLGDFYQRVLNRGAPRTVLTGREEPTAALVQLGVRR